MTVLRLVKSEEGMSPYIMDSNTSFRSVIAKLRLSDHNLEIERGRYKNIIPSRRICKVCRREVDDVPHMLFSCSLYREERSIFFNRMEAVDSDFVHNSVNGQMKSILNPNNANRKLIASFLKTVSEMRRTALGN